MATTLVVMAMDRFGPEAFTWAPETLIHEIRDESGAALPTHNLDRLMAGIHLVTTDDFYRDLSMFNDLCVVLAGNSAPVGWFIPASATDAAWGITEALLLSPPDPNDETPFSDDIRAYLGALLRNEGIMSPPDILKMAIHDQAIISNVSSDYSDDPEMFSAIWGAEKSKTDDINNTVRKRLRQLIDQLVALPLREGSTKKLAQRLLHSLPG